MKIHVSLADDHSIFVKGLHYILQDDDRITLDAIWPDTAQLMAGLALAQPDILILGIGQQFYAGCDVLPLIRKTYPGLKILLLSHFDNIACIDYALKNGCAGYVLRNTCHHNLMHAIRSVAEEDFYLAAEHHNRLLQYRERLRINHAARYTFTAREKDILRLIIDGYNNQEIADKLCISTRTVENYRYNLSMKLEVKNTAAMVCKVMELNLLSY